MANHFPVILFYKYASVADPKEFAAAQRALCEALDLKGRILIAEEGINGTLAGSAAAKMMSFYIARPRFGGSLRDSDRFRIRKA
jgi:UPF0176 protein